jgi:sigma-B regulation protein RsbU (phosphoserine phosphatase)
LTQTDHAFFRTLIEDRRESFLEWLSEASGEGRETGAHQAVLRSLERALERIQEGDFGDCAECDGSVEQELLAARPDTRICLECMDEAERHQLEEDLQLAQEINRSMMPRAAPEIGSWELGIHYRPSRILSGDFYDVIIQRSSNEVALAVGDVAGKGIPAGLLRTSLQATLRTLSHQSLSPGELLAEANRHFVDSSHPGRFASVFYGLIRPDQGTLLYANGGHLPPLLRRASGDWDVLGSTGTVLGILEGLTYPQKSCSIGPGDLLVLYTDGVTEAEDPSGQFYDERNLVNAVDRLASLPAQELVDRLAEELDRFSSGPPSDDRTLVVLRRLRSF